MSKSLAKHIVSSMLSFIMMICISVLVLIICLALTLFNVGFITYQMNDTYYFAAIDSLNNTLKNEIAPPSGFPEEVFDDLFNKGVVQEDSIACVKSIMLGLDLPYNTPRIRQLLMDRFTEFAQQNNIPLNDNNLDSLTDYCIEEYEQQIVVSYLKSFAPIKRTFDNYFTYALLSFSALLILATLFLFRIHKFKHRALRFSIYSLFASSLILIPLPLILLIHGGYTKINIMPEHVKMLFVSMMRSTLLSVLLGGLILAAIGFLLILLTNRMRQKLIYQE